MSTQAELAALPVAEVLRRARAGDVRAGLLAAVVTGCASSAGWVMPWRKH
jgi:hypothetical protein